MLTKLFLDNLLLAGLDVNTVSRNGLVSFIIRINIVTESDTIDVSNLVREKMQQERFSILSEYCKLLLDY